MKKKIKHRSRSARRTMGLPPRTADDLFAKPKQFQDKWIRATHVVSKMRADGASLNQTSKEFGLSPRTVQRLVGTAIRKRPNGRYAAKANDRLLRVLVIPTNKGSDEIAVRDSRQATHLAEYWIAVHGYLQTGDASSIEKFRRKHIIDANGKRVRLVTELDELNRLGSAGAFSFESLYARAN
jgi:lambda repressor-like predicted transcriptional regulator